MLVSLFYGAFGTSYGLSETLLRMGPILLCALAAALPAEGGQINIGGEGQFHLGAIGAAVAATALSGLPAALVVPLMCVAAMCCGAAWGAIPGFLRARLAVNEALVSLFLNYIAIHLLQYLVHGPLRDPASLGWAMSAPLPQNLIICGVGGSRLNLIMFSLIALALGLVAITRLTRGGVELRAVGLNPRASATVGIPVGRYLLLSMVIGGALAGLAGYFELASVQYRLRADVALGFGYSGFLVAWICRSHLWLILPVSLLVAGLTVGSESLQIVNGLPSASGDVAQGFLLLFVLLSHPALAWFERRRAIRIAMEAA
jgi:simple sugar transport system permease protein